MVITSLSLSCGKGHNTVNFVLLSRHFYTIVYCALFSRIECEPIECQRKGKAGSWLVRQKQNCSAVRSPESSRNQPLRSSHKAERVALQYGKITVIKRQ